MFSNQLILTERFLFIGRNLRHFARTELKLNLKDEETKRKQTFYVSFLMVRGEIDDCLKTNAKKNTLQIAITLNS